MIAVCAIVFVLALLVISVVEIRAHFVVANQIEQQEEELANLQKQKDYYNSQNGKDNTTRDSDGDYGNSGDLTFTEE